MRSGKFLIISFIVIMLTTYFGVTIYKNWQVRKTIRQYAAQYKIDYALALDIAKAESSLNPWARGRDGGIGLYQFMPKTWAWATKRVFGEELDFNQAKDLKTNTEVAMWFIGWIQQTLQKEGYYSEAAVIYAFNAGIGRLRKNEYRIPIEHRNRIYNSYYKSHHNMVNG